MVQGTASGAGKSVVATALCRLFATEGIRVAPFKGVNMSLEAGVTGSGAEIGRAQIVQAEACGLDASADMNPVLLKPQGPSGCQVVLRGKAAGTVAGWDGAMDAAMRSAIAEGLARLRATCELVVIEGAGSPAEINLRDRDLANMHVARLADAPVILVGDIDRGGVFAALLGTLELLDATDRARVAGLVVNKLRGDVRGLAPGLAELERRARVPVLGVLPFVHDIGIADEDAVALEGPRRARPSPDTIDVAVIHTPRISNFDDVQALAHEPGVAVRFVDAPHEIDGADLVVLPGSKGTAEDLLWMRQRGLDRAVVDRARRGEPVLGICGGCQILGRSIDDPHHVESACDSLPALDLLPVRTVFERVKVTAQVRARVRSASFLTGGAVIDDDLFGYEIHMGALEPLREDPPGFDILTRNGEPIRVADGAVSGDGSVVGTMIHGILENDPIRDAMLAWLRRRKGLPPPAERTRRAPGDAYDALAALVRRHLDVPRIRRIAGV